MSRLFGTDGVRGLANRGSTAELALTSPSRPRTCSARSAPFAGHRPAGGRRPRPAGLRRVPRGRRRRRPGHRRASTSDDAGVLPTPAVAYLTAAPAPTSASCSPRRTTRCPTTASSSSPAAGTSWPTRSRTTSSAGWARLAAAHRARTSVGCGRSPRPPTATSDLLLRTLPHRLDGLRVVVDCAHGARQRRLPACSARGRAPTSSSIGAEPDGLNINDGFGSTHLDPLQEAVVEHGADAGIAHDGDADRCLAVDATGHEVDGDQIMADPRPGAQGARALRRRHPRRHRDEQPRAPPGDACARASGPCRPASGTATCWRRCARRLHPRRRAVRARHHARPRHHRRRRPHRPALLRPDGRRPGDRWPTSPRS